MLLTLRSTTAPATDLGYLLHKHPAKMQEFSLNFGKAQVFYPEADEQGCTAALLVSVDPIALVRTRQGPGGEGGMLDRYVNDRPYAASSFLSVAIAEVFGSALGGRCKEKPEMVDQPLDLEATVSVLACRHGEDLLRRFFEPLGYVVEATRLPLDSSFPEWGKSRYFSLKLKGRQFLRSLLSHLYVLIPVLDNNKHYWIGSEEVEKLLAKGEGWLATHPERELITQRYLRYQRSLVDSALDRLVPEESIAPDVSDEAKAASEPELRLHDQRLGTVLAALKTSGAKRVLDLGCGGGKLLKLLLPEKQFEQMVGMDVSHQAIESARRYLRYDQLPDWQRNRLSICQGSLIYRDERLHGFDAAAVVEVIEHLDPPRLIAFERNLFEFAKPGTVIITTPNGEYNVKWASLEGGGFRHSDHRFEWSRNEFQSWANRVAHQHGYRVRFLSIGPEDADVGSPSQMAIFEHAASWNAVSQQAV